MYLPENYLQSVLFCFITMLCWGSWANTQKLAGKTWRFELFYWDYVLGILIFAVISAFTLGSYGPTGRSFSEDIHLAKQSNILWACLGGIIFNLANIFFVTAINIMGMAVAFPIAIGIALVLGVIVNYLALPVGNSTLLFTGVGFIVVAILFTALAYKKLLTQKGQMSSKGFVLALSGGILMGLFYRFVAASMTTDFYTPEPGKLTPYTAVFFMAVGVLVSNFIFNTVLMKRPLDGKPLSAPDYFKGNVQDHLAGIAGGMIWGLGTSLNIIASGKAGYAISYGLGQGATLIAAIWGVFIWKEFKNAPGGTSTLITLMFICYISGLCLIVYSR